MVGDCGPYRQSERRDIYRKYVQQLLDAGKAYSSPSTPPEELGRRSVRTGSELPVRRYDPHLDAQFARPPT